MTRKPAAFRIEPETAEPPGSKTTTQPRRPRAVPNAVVVPAEVDVFEEPDLLTAEPPPATPPRRRSWLGTIFFGAAGILVSLALGLWADRLIRDLF